jgi:hypothetical protein
VTEYFLGAYWQPRKESIEECADRFLAFFADLVRCDDMMSRWFELGRSRKQALKRQIDLADRDSLLDLLEGGRHWTDYDHRLMEDMGFAAMIWNGGDDHSSARLTVSCGCYSDFKPFPNNVIMDLPHDLGSLADVSHMRCIMASVVAAWEPLWAGVLSFDAHDKRQGEGPVVNPFVDWMVYIDHQWLPKVPKLYPPASAESVASGTLIVTQDEPPDPLNDVHAENIRRVDVALRSVWHVPS